MSIKIIPEIHQNDTQHFFNLMLYYVG